MDKQDGFPTSDTPLYGTGYNQYALDGEVYDREFLDKLYNFWRQKKIEDELLNALNHLDLFPDQESYTEDEFAERRNALMTKLTPLWNMHSATSPMTNAAWMSLLRRMSKRYWPGRNFLTHKEDIV